MVGGGEDCSLGDISESWCQTYLPNVSAVERAQVLIISNAAPPWEAVNVWETNQFLVQRSLLM